MFLIVVCAVAALFFPYPARAQVPKLTVSYAEGGAPDLPAFVAKETGIFAKNGLDVQLVRSRSTVSVMALLSGELGIIQVAGPTVVESNLSGSDVVMIAGGTATLPYKLVSEPRIKTGKQLKGAIVGIASLSGVSIYATRFALKMIGLNADKDVSMIVAGGTMERLVGLRTGKINATLLSPPTIFIAEREGLNMLADVASLGLVFQNDGVASTRKFIKNNPDVVRRYVRSHVESVHRMKTDRETGLKVMAKYLRQTDRELLEKTYDYTVTDDMLPRKQYPVAAGIKTILDLTGDRNPKAKLAKPEDFVDTSFVKELDEAGFIDSLYKTKKD
jgi:ABC-type nitrate/sulfonate/bicarbonate transport system substrate-binding protein